MCPYRKSNLGKKHHEILMNCMRVWDIWMKAIVFPVMQDKQYFLLKKNLIVHVIFDILSGYA